MNDLTPTGPILPAYIGQPRPKDSGLAIASMITGILAWILLPLFGALAAIITGHLAKRDIKESNGALTGSGMATAGLILGYIQLGFIVVGLVVLIIFLFTSPQVSDILRNASLGM